MRAVAVLAVIGYHLGIPWLSGGWLGVDLFFVLSGFLITSVLLAEHRTWGRIDLPRFWAGRARRLLPGLITMLLTVSLLSFFWVIPARRTAVSEDVFAALCYVANWRLLLSDDSYFSTLALPSPVVHTWSLAIEEQYYLVFPLLVIIVLAITARRRRRTRLQILAGVLVALTAASAWQMARLYVPAASPDRVYYGTDTRGFELLVGAVAAVLAMLARGRPTAATRLAAWPSLIALVAAFFVVHETDSYVFRGGLLVLCCLAAVVITVCARSDSQLVRLLSWEPLRRVGVLSYSLYLWHWPVIVFLNADRLGMHGLLLGCVQTLVSVLAAMASHRWIEQPIHDGGLRALIPHRPRPGRWLAAAGVIVLVTATALSPHMANATVSTAGGNLVFHADRADQSLPKRSVVLIGNSVPQSLVVYYDNSQPRFTVRGTTSFGCDPFDGNEKVGDSFRTPPEDCLTWRSQWPGPIRKAPTDLAVYMIPQNLVSDYRVDGKLLSFDSAAWRKFLTDALDDIKRKSLAAGAKHFAVTTLACHDLPMASVNPEFKLINDIPRVRRLNTAVKQWAHRTDTSVIDLYGRLCPGNSFHGSANGAPLYDDGFHFTQKSAPLVWRWLTPQMRSVMSTEH